MEKNDFVLVNKNEKKDVPINIEISDRIKYLLKSCETICVSDCCGLDAFDISPLNIAAHLNKYGTGIRIEDVKEIKLELEKILLNANSFPKNSDGYICQIKEINQFFREEELKELLNSIIEALEKASLIVNYNNEIIKNSQILRKWNKIE